MINRWTGCLFVGVLALILAPCRAQESKSVNSKADSTPQSIDELLLFFPSKFPTGDWQPRNLQFKDVFFSAEDKTKLHGWHCPCDNPRAVVLFAHGNAGHIAYSAPWLRYLQTKMRVSVFAFDYRGYGRSEGTPTVAGAIQDATAARAKLRELAGVKDAEMLLMGESLGGAIAVQLAADSAPQGLILQSTFSSLRDVAAVHYPESGRLTKVKNTNKHCQQGDPDRAILTMTAFRALLRSCHRRGRMFLAMNTTCAAKLMQAILAPSSMPAPMAGPDL